MSSFTSAYAASFGFFQNVAPKAGTPVVAQESAPAGGTAAPQGAPAQQAAPPQGMLMTFLPFLILLPFVWMMFRRQKKEQAERAKLKKGDRVVTQSGLVGELVEMADPVSKLKIAAGVTIEVLTSSLASFPTVAKKDDVKADAKVATEKK